MDGTESLLIDVHQVAVLLNCSWRHVYRLADSGRMPAPLKIGNLTRWDRSAVKEWIAGGCKPLRSGAARPRQNRVSTVSN